MTFNKVSVPFLISGSSGSLGLYKGKDLGLKSETEKPHIPVSSPYCVYGCKPIYDV